MKLANMLQTFINEKYRFLILCLFMGVPGYSQCILNVNNTTADILVPFANSVPWETIPCDTVGKWQKFNCTPSKENFAGEYSVFSMSGLVGKTKITSVDTAYEGPDCGPILNLSTEFKTKDLYGIKATWNPIPRTPVVIANTNLSYLQAVKEILSQKSELKNASVVINKIVKIDLDNDQKDEVIIHATNHNAVFDCHKGDYSLVLLRRIVNEKVVTEIIHFDYIETEQTQKEREFQEPQFLKKCNISAILDLDGDGKMELIITDEVYEGIGVTVYELKQNGLRAVLQWGCGA
jgi:hypothetical protein